MLPTYRNLVGLVLLYIVLPIYIPTYNNNYIVSTGKYNNYYLMAINLPKMFNTDI